MLFSRAAAVCAIGFGLAFLAETALTAQGQEILTMQLQREGRCVVWGAPVDGAGVTSSRGVALLGGPGVRVEPIGVPAELNEQWRDGRIVAGKARVGDDAQFNEVTCVACYADVYDASARETLFERLLSWLVNIKGHVILGGDFNADLDDSPALFSLLDRGYHTANVGHDITCCAHGSSKGSVVDHLMLSPSLRPAFCHGGVLSEAPFPTHRPVVADFVGRLVEDTWETLRLPRPLPVVGCAPTVDADIRYKSERAHIESLLAAGRPLDAYEAWATLAEEDLVFACRRQGKQVTAGHRGRGGEPELCPCAPLRLAGCALRGDADARRLERARSGLAELCYQWQLSHNQGTHVSIWTNARRRLMLVEPSLNLPSAVPSRVQVESLLDWLRAEINRRHGQERHSALSQWRASLISSQAARFRWAKAKHVKWQNVFDSPACFAAVERVWKPILCRDRRPNPGHVSVGASGTASAPLDLRAVAQLDLLSITGADLRSAVKRTSLRTACGPDGWRRDELLVLPGPLWDSLASVLRGMAASSKWHPSLVTVVTSLIPKREHVDFLKAPGELRPISVASLIFRAWGSCLAKRLSAVLECSLTTSVHGFRAAESAQCVMSHTLLQSQNARLSGRDVHFIAYDIRKCFDSLPWQEVWSSLIDCGVGRATADALYASWHSLRRIWKLQGRFQWASFNASNGLFQGDPTAPACLTAFLASPVQQVRQRWPQVSVSQYADDVQFASSDAVALREAHEFFASWLLERGVQLHASKCKWASTAAEPDVPAFCVQRTRLQRTRVLETLGGHFVLGPDPDSPTRPVFPAGCRTRWQALHDEVLRTANRLGKLSVGWELRSIDLGALLPAITYSALAWCPVDDDTVTRDSRLLVNVLSGNSHKENSRRCVEVSLALLSPVHRCSLREALLHEQVLILFRLLNTNADYRATVRQHFALCTARNAPPNDSFFVSFQAALARLGWRWVAWDTLLDHRGREHCLTVTLLEARRAQMRSAIAGVQSAESLPGLVADMAHAHASAVHALRAPVLHLLREAMRNTAFTEASRRRRDMRGLPAVDRGCLAELWRRVPKTEHPTLRFLMQGAAMTASRSHRSTRGRVSPACHFCHSP